MCSVEHCSSVPISLCGFQVTELALTTRNIAVTGTWDNYYLIIPSTIKKCPESPRINVTNTKIYKSKRHSHKIERKMTLLAENKSSVKRFAHTYVIKVPHSRSTRTR